MTMPWIMDHAFVGRREWGICPPYDAPCQATIEDESGRLQCGKPHYAHRTQCHSTLMIAGESYPCDVGAPHDGWAHANKKAEAIWGEGRQSVELTQYRAAVKGTNRSIELNLNADPVQPLVDFLRWLQNHDENGGMFARTDAAVREISEKYCKQKGLIDAD